MKDVVLYHDDGEVYVQIGKDYFLHLAPRDVIESLEAREIVLLTSLSVVAHTQQTVH